MTLWLLTRMAVELAALSYKPLFFVVVGTSIMVRVTRCIEL